MKMTATLLGSGLMTLMLSGCASQSPTQAITVIRCLYE
ncbi:hypothetical protein EIO60_02554|nr:hypothetical protein [Candidatus Pantoea persica]